MSTYEDDEPVLDDVELELDSLDEDDFVDPDED